MNGRDGTAKFVCMRCGKSFRRKFNMERHIQTMHSREDSAPMDEEESEYRSSEESEREDPQSESSDQENSEPKEESDVLEDNAVFREWLDVAKDGAREMRESKYEKYVNHGVNEGEAMEKAYVKSLPEVKRIFFDHYETFLWRYQTLRYDEIHQEIVEDLEGRLDGGVDIRHAVKRAMAKHKHEFEGLFQYENEDDDEEDDVDSQDD